MKIAISQGRSIDFWIKKFLKNGVREGLAKAAKITRHLKPSLERHRNKQKRERSKKK